MDKSVSLLDQIKTEAQNLGFSQMGICAPSSIPKAQNQLEEFLKNNYHGQMEWLENRKTWRGNPEALWPEARSVIMLAEPYTPGEDPLAVLKCIDRGAISVYARNRDYHDLVKKKLKSLGRWLIEAHGGEIKVFVDTAPVMEKPLAEAAGLGWIGKHTNLVSQNGGSWFFLGAIFTTLDLEKTKVEVDHCGNCRRCLDICPTHAFPEPYKIDARRCISYLTIEHKGAIDPELRPLLGNRIYGCDDCLAVCPWNKFATPAIEAGYLPRLELMRPKLAHLVSLTEDEFRDIFKGSPIKRIGIKRFIRNVLYAIGNSKELGLIPYVEPHLNSEDPVIREAAEWALTRLRGLQNG